MNYIFEKLHSSSFGFDGQCNNPAMHCIVATEQPVLCMVGSVLTLPCHFVQLHKSSMKSAGWTSSFVSMVTSVLTLSVLFVQLHKSLVKSAGWTSSCVSAVTSVCLPATNVTGKSTVRTDLMRSAVVSSNMNAVI